MSGEQDLVGLVAVSHSRALATAAVALAGEMLNGRDVAIEIAAGPDETTLGTDAVAVRTAIESVAARTGRAGVVVLMDLGSAVLSAEMALELLEDDDLRERVVLSPAPFVEGLVAAAVAAAGGADRHEVAAEAGNGLLGKTSQLTDATAQTPAVTTDRGEIEAVATFTVTNPHGLHARPAAVLVSAVGDFDASVRLANLTTGADAVPADSMMWVTTLGAEQGHQLQVSATGAQAQQAVDRIRELAAQGFTERVGED